MSFPPATTVAQSAAQPQGEIARLAEDEEAPEVYPAMEEEAAEADEAEITAEVERLMEKDEAEDDEAEGAYITGDGSC